MFDNPGIIYTNSKGELITLKWQELNFTFHNPNTEEETVKHVSKLLAETTVNRVAKARIRKCNTKESCLAQNNKGAS
jgi:hypothetical protein